MDNPRLILVRHGESSANRDGLFTGIWDVPLTESGRQQARRAARALLTAGLRPDLIFTSAQLRTEQTVAEMVTVLGPPAAPVRRDWRWNERNYGDLTGRTKTAVRAEFGPEQFRSWRRSLYATPPPLSAARRAELARSYRARGALLGQVGATESLADVIGRVGAALFDEVIPALRTGAAPLLVAHGNSLRAVCAVLDDLTEAEIMDLNLPTAQPLVYTFAAPALAARTLRPRVRGGTYLDPQAAHAAAARIAAEGGT